MTAELASEVVVVIVYTGRKTLSFGRSSRQGRPRPIVYRV